MPGRNEIGVETQRAPWVLSKRTFFFCIFFEGLPLPICRLLLPPGSPDKSISVSGLRGCVEWTKRGGFGRQG